MKIYSYVDLADAQKTYRKFVFTFFVTLTPFGPESYHYHGVFDKNKRKKINNVEVYKKAEKTLSPNVSTTPIKAMGCQQCLPLSVVQLKGKHCQVIMVNCALI